MKAAGLNLFFRGLTLGSKFLLAIFIARYLTLEELGIYGLFSVSVTLAVYLIGLDFYTFSVRHLLENPVEQRGTILRDQLVFYLMTYLIFLPPLYLLFLWGVLSAHYILAFYGILVLEHISQEFYRLFVTFSRPVTANIILFIRSGLWICVVIGAWLMGMEELQNIDAVIWSWFTGVALSVLISVLLLSQFKLRFSGTPINWQYIKTGFLVSLPFFAGTIAYKIVEFSDRYLVDFFHGEKMLGIYTFYAGIGNMVEIAVHATVVVIFSPKLIESFTKDKTAYTAIFSDFSKQVFWVTAAVLVLLGIAIFPIIHFLKKPEFSEYLDVFFWLAAAKALFNFSLLYHYQLYVHKADKRIMMATFAGAGSNILLNLILIPLYSISGAAIATFVSFGIIYFAKVYLYKRIKVSDDE